MAEGKTVTQSSKKRLWKNEYFQTAVMIIIIIAIVFGGWFGSQLLLNTQYPMLAVATGSMCTVQHMACDGYSHPFDQTLHVGDLIIIQGTDPNNIHDNYPDSDIIVFERPKSSPYEEDSLIVHRVVYKEEHNGLVYFRTKGDANNILWPAPVTKSQCDPWIDYRGENYTWDQMVSQNMVKGKVLLRIPWVGHLSLYLRNSAGIYIIIALLILLIVVEFVLPLFRKKTPEIETKQTEEQDSTQPKAF